jgi:hypothetical protein
MSPEHVTIACQEPVGPRPYPELPASCKTTKSGLRFGANALLMTLVNQDATAPAPTRQHAFDPILKMSQLDAGGGGGGGGGKKLNETEETNSKRLSPEQHLWIPRLKGPNALGETKLGVVACISVELTI